jgi:hypothetical protein
MKNLDEGAGSMHKPTTFLPALVLGAVGGMALATPSLATPITYTETATATGFLNGSPFTNATVTLEMTNDTTNVTNPSTGIFHNQQTSDPATDLMLSISGIGGTATFTDSIQAAVSQSVPDAGFGDLTNNTAILFTKNAAFSTYDLKSAITAVSGTPFAFNPTASFQTSAGLFMLTSVASASFAATTSAAVPEPTSFALLGAALAGFGLIRRRLKS